MLGELAPDLRTTIGVDTVNLHGPGTMFGFSQKEFKSWRMADGTPVLVPRDFNTQYEPNGDLLQWPGGDRSVLPSGRMPEGGSFFDAIIRQEPLNEEHLNPADNTVEFTLVTADEFEHYRALANQLYRTTDQALVCTSGGLTFGDIALVPAPFLKRPRGIRDLAEWYMSTVSRPEYIQAVFERQAEVAIENLRRLHVAVGDRPTVIQTDGTVFGTQNGPLCSVAKYRELYLPYQKRVNGWNHRHTQWKTLMHRWHRAAARQPCRGGVRHLESRSVFRHAWYRTKFIVPFQRKQETETRFIPARVSDNSFNNPEYRKVLENLSGWQKRAWLDGEWDIAAGQYFTTFRRDVHVIEDFDDTRAREWFAALDYGFAHYSVCLLGCKDGDPSRGRARSPLRAASRPSTPLSQP